MKKTLLGLLFTAMVVLVAFGSIAVLTRLSEVDEDPKAAIVGDDLSAEEVFDDLDYDLAQTEDDCLLSEQWDAEELVCYYECDTDEECAAIEAQLEQELSEIYDNAAGQNNFNDQAPTNADITIYTIDRSQISAASGSTIDPRAQDAWALFISIAPNDFIESNFVRYETYDDEGDDTSAYVLPSEDNPSKWILGVNLAATHPGGRLDKTETIFTMVHEFAHVLTLEANQVPPDISLNSGGAASCSAFFTGEGCAKAGSYINQFFQMFWGNIYDTLPSEDASESERNAFYDRYQEQFVTDYAASNPGEDIAESFAAFVLKPMPDDNSIADAKVRFFYEYPELVRLRSQIRARLI